MTFNRPLAFDVLWPRTVSVVSSVLMAVGLLFMAPVLAKEKADCDCMDVKLEPSKDRIKINRSKAVDQQLRAVQRAKPKEYEFLKKIVTTADTFLQRHMNGDIYQDQSPDDWRDYNGPIMAMKMEEWMRMRSEGRDKDFSHWTLCPRAEMKTLEALPEKTVVRYELVTVGRFVRVGKTAYNSVFNDGENGKLFAIEVTFNGQAKVVEMRQIPQGQYSSPYTTVVRTLKQRIKKKPATDFGETLQKMNAENALYIKEIGALEQAAKVCGPTVNIGK